MDVEGSKRDSSGNRSTLFFVVIKGRRVERRRGSIDSNFSFGQRFIRWDEIHGGGGLWLIDAFSSPFLFYFIFFFFNLTLYNAV